MLLIVKKVLEEEYATLFINMQNLITSIRKIMKKNKESSYIQYWDVNNLYV